MLPISFKELENNIKELKSGKIEKNCFETFENSEKFWWKRKNVLFILEIARKRVKICWTLKTKKNRFDKFKKVFFSKRFGILKQLDKAFQNLKNRVEIFQNDFWKNTFCPSLLLARKMLLEMFNNVMTGAQIPSDWKIGDIVLILKKLQCADINNYQPITLISCVSKSSPRSWLREFQLQWKKRIL